jgi:hypothetical protein
VGDEGSWAGGRQGREHANRTEESFTRHWTVEIDRRQNTKRQATIANLISSRDLKILVRQWGYRAKIDPVLVLDAKGGENKAKAINGSATT